MATASFLERLVAQREPHVVVAGDFDATPDAASMRFWRGRQALGDTSVCYRDAWEHTHPGDAGHTFTPENPMVADGTWPLERGRRIDHVLVRCREHGPSLDIAACAQIFDQPVGGSGAATTSASSPTWPRRRRSRWSRSEPRGAERQSSRTARSS